MTKLVLVTGGAGFIGARLSENLLRRGWKVRILDTLSAQVHGADAVMPEWTRQDGVEPIHGSITDRDTLAAALTGVQAVAHLAAETGTGQSMYEIARYNEVNSQGTALLLDVLANSPRHQVRRLVLTSSRSVYGEGRYRCRTCEDGPRFPDSRSADALADHRWDPVCSRCGAALEAQPTHEDDRLLPASIYAATKLAQEDLVRVACNSMGIGHAILRLQNVYGEGQSLQNPYTGILSIFSTKIRHGLELPLFEDGAETRDFVHVDDVGEALALTLTAETAANATINVGSGIGTSVRQVAEMLSDAMGAPRNVRVTGQYRLGDIRHNAADISRLKTMLSYEPRVDLATGLSRFARWASGEALPEDRLERANAELRRHGLMS